MTNRTAAVILVTWTLICTGPAIAGPVDYFVVNNAGADGDLRIFAYDTTAKTIALVDTVTLSGDNTAHNKRVSAGAAFSFWAGGSGTGSPEGVERFIANGTQTAWTSEVAVHLTGQTGANEYYDSSVRGVVSTDPVGPGGAELSDGTLFVAESRDTYAIGNAAGESGTVTAVFTADSQHMGNPDSTLGGVAGGLNPADVASTIAGSAGRFAVTGGGADADVMVYNSNGTFKADLTNISGLSNSAVGSMKTAGMGDVILQLGANRAESPTIKVNGRSVAEATFDQLIIGEFTIAKPSSGDYFIEATDVDGTQSGLIIVIGEARGGGVDSPAVQFFDTSGNPTTANPFQLEDYDPTLNSTKVGGAALFIIPEPATMGLLALGGLAAMLRRRRR